VKPSHQITADAVVIRGIIDYLEKSVEPVGLHELAMTQHVSNTTALRLCRILEKATIIEHPVVTRVVMGASQEVPQLAWRLTKSFWLGGCIYNAERLAGGVA
jgi:hypothetical protein